MRNIQKLLMLLALVFICFSCEDSAIDGIDVGKYEMSITLPVDSLSYLSFAKEGGTKTILLTANNKWSAIVSNIEDESWLRIDIKEGNAGENQAVIITTEPNISFKDRNGEVILVCGTTPLKVTVQQGSLTDIVVPAGTKELTLDKDEPSVIVQIESNLEMEVEITSEVETQEQWLFCVPTPVIAPQTKGLKLISYTITTLTNYGVPRKGEVIFKNPETDARDTIKVTQETEHAIIIQSEKTHNLEYDSTTPIEVLIDANVEITPTITYSAGTDWLTVSSTATQPTNTLESYTFTITPIANPLNTNRTAKVAFASSTDPIASDTLTISQKGKGKIEITTPTNPTASIKYEAHTYKVTVHSTNVETIKVNISDVVAGADGEQAWMTYDANIPPVAVVGEEGSYTYSFAVKVNGIGARSAKITFSNANEATISDNVIITQKSSQDKLEIKLVGKPTWIHTDKLFANPYTETEYIFSISTDMGWTVRGDNDNFVIVDKRSDDAANFYQISVNIPIHVGSASSEDREITLNFTSGNNIDQKVVIFQKDSKVSAHLTGQGKLKDAVEKYSAYLKTDLTLVTYLTITSGTGVASATLGEPGTRPDDGASLNAADFTYMKTLTNLKYLDISGTKVNTAMNAIIPAGLGSMTPTDAHKKIETIVLWANVPLATDARTITSNAFANCINLKTINFPTNLTNIAGSAFLNTSLGPKITLPSTIKSIGAKAFMSCKLEEVIIKAQLPPIITPALTPQGAANGGNRSFDPQNVPFIDVTPKFYVPDPNEYLKVTTTNTANHWPHARYKDRIFIQSN